MRVPRKMKKAAKKGGWEIRFFESGKIYYVRTIVKFRWHPIHLD